MKKLLTGMLATTLALTLVACGSTDTSTSTPSTSTTTPSTSTTTTPPSNDTTASTDDTASTPDFVTVNAKNGDGDWVDMDVPYAPTKVAFMDYVSLDMCATLGLLDGMEYMAVQDALPDYLAAELGSDIFNLGGLKGYQEDDSIGLSIMDFEPELIFTSGRAASDYNMILDWTENGEGGVVTSSITYVPSTYESFKEINIRNASIFGKDEEMAEIISQYDDRLDALKAWGEGKTAVMAIFTGGSMNTLGNESRCSMIFNDLGFQNLAADVNESHGDMSSYEVLLALDPDFLFILDRDNAIGEEGASTAMQLLDNDIVRETQAWQNGRVVELDPIIWYMVEGGITAMDYMLSDLEVGMAMEE